jgi:hypothetical protein
MKPASKLESNPCLGLSRIIVLLGVESESKSKTQLANISAVNRKVLKMDSSSSAKLHGFHQLYINLRDYPLLGALTVDDFLEVGLCGRSQDQKFRAKTRET